MLLFHGALTRLSLREISERRANLGMKVEKRATADLQSVQVSESGTVFPLRFLPCAVMLTYDQSNGPFVSAFCLCAAVTRNRQIILFEWLFPDQQKGQHNNR